MQMLSARDPSLLKAIREAATRHEHMLQAPHGRWVDSVLRGDEEAASPILTQDLENFYEDHALQPYVPLEAEGPWVVTAHGAVVHDNGGYGMLSFGQNNQAVLEALCQRQVMGNVMTPSFSQAAFGEAIRREVGHARGACPYERFVCLNSGSEALAFALRLSDAHAKGSPGSGGPGQPRETAIVTLKGSFHGRPDGPAHVSDSCSEVYSRHLRGFRSGRTVIAVEPNDAEGLEAAFAGAERAGLQVQAMLLEPVMGEGNPGLSISPGFYGAARRLTRRHGCLLIVDSVQAGLRAAGALSVVDYPGFEGCEAPDMEAWSKAINAGQFPLSVVGLGAEARAAYVKGIYGNSMAANPRALDIACAVLRQVTPGVRRNIRERGRELLSRFEEIAEEFPAVVEKVTGSGLLLAIHMHAAFPVAGRGGLEEACRRRGLGVIRGGRNALRFTPWFNITDFEVELVASIVRGVLAEAAASRGAAGDPRPALRPASSEMLLAVVNGILEGYSQRTPTAVRAAAVIAGGAGGAPAEGPSTLASLPLDHFAFRTFACSGPMSGIGPAARMWEAMGYRLEAEVLRFPEKKLRARWLSPPAELRQLVGGCPAPRVFVSEVVVGDLPARAAEIVRGYVEGLCACPEVAALSMTGGAGTGETRPPLPWGALDSDDYQELLGLHSVAAWTLANGFGLNHAALAVHWLPDPDLDRLNARLVGSGIAMNDDGGMVKTSPDGLLRQSSSFSDGMSLRCIDGKECRASGSYIEFVQRLLLPEHRQLPPGEITDYHYRDGFETANASRIFTSTDGTQS